MVEQTFTPLIVPPLDILRRHMEESEAPEMPPVMTLAADVIVSAEENAIPGRWR